MTIEAASLMRRRTSDGVDVGHVHDKRRKRLCVRSTANDPLQALFHCCTQLFIKGRLPSTHHNVLVKMMSRILDCTRPEDVGLSEDLHFFKPKPKIEGGTPRVTSATIYKSHHFELCIFFLPANAVIPLHNHPGMTVFSKLLVGSMHIKAYDWCDSDDYSSMPPPKLKLATLKADKTFTAPCNTFVLHPTSGGNIHEFRAVTPCVVLDVIGPPYSKGDGRDCSYYKEIPCHSLVEDKAQLVNGVSWLEEIEIPEESEMDGIEYMGPQIIDSTSH